MSLFVNIEDHMMCIRGGQNMYQHHKPIAFGLNDQVEETIEVKKVFMHFKMKSQKANIDMFIMKLSNSLHIET